MVTIFDDVNPDPDMATVRKGVLCCQQCKPDILVCLGGGSPMDAGKFIRVLYEHPDLSLEDAAARFLELRKRTCPFPVLGTKIKKVVCIPTTSGTASEVTPFSVITDDEGMKHPLFS
jgi:acetaldehyde dehydrogenase / alcohol dehydrogenase